MFLYFFVNFYFLHFCESLIIILKLYHHQKRTKSKKVHGGRTRQSELPLTHWIYTLQNLYTMSGKQYYKNYTKCIKNDTFYSDIIFSFGDFICFGAWNNCFRDFVFFGVAISFGTGAVNRKLQNQEKQSRGKINFGRQKNRKQQKQK